MLMSVNVQGERPPGMETKWYVPPGKTLANTKIDERKLALHTTKEAWKTITGHLDRKRLQAGAIQKEIDHKNYIMETSKAMTENWDNSVENIRKRKEEERIRRIEQSKEDKMQRFFTLRKEQQEIREQYIKDKKKELYVMHGPPKELNSALLLSEVIYERERQKDMKDFLEQHRLEEEAKYAEKVKQAALDEIREKREVKEKEIAKKMEIRKMYLEEMENKKRLNEMKRQKQINEEKEDILAAGREAATMKQIEIEQEIKKREDAKKEFDEYYAKQKQYKLQMEKEADEQNRVIEIFATMKCRIEETRKRKEEEALKNKRLRAEKIAEAVATVAASKQAEEDRIIKEAQEEKERLELEKIAERAEYDKKLIKERLENREKVLKDQELRKNNEAEVNKWITLNRYKSEEVVKAKEEAKRVKKRQDILNYRDQLTEQINERKVLDEEFSLLNGKEYEFEQEQRKKEDDMFLDYAKEVTDLATKRGRLLYPINRVIMDYKKQNNLVPSHKERMCAIKGRQKKELVNCTPGKASHDPKTDPNLKQRREDFKQFLYS